MKCKLEDCRWFKNGYANKPCNECINAVLDDHYEPVKDEPMSPDQWMKYNYKIEYRRANHYHFNDMKHAFKAGATENEKKHRLQQSFNEWERSQPKYYVSDNRNDIFVARKEGWQAHAKATNTEA